jgi:hypothetical protein
MDAVARDNKRWRRKRSSITVHSGSSTHDIIIAISHHALTSTLRRYLAHLTFGILFFSAVFPTTFHPILPIDLGHVGRRGATVSNK